MEADPLSETYFFNTNEKIDVEIDVEYQLLYEWRSVDITLFCL
jgi:hypothetical protein